jgi:hypothetical protein
MKLSDKIHCLTYKDAVLFYEKYHGLGSWSRKTRYDRSNETVLLNKAKLCLHRLLRNGIDVILDDIDKPVIIAPVKTTKQVVEKKELPNEALLSLDSNELHEKKQIASSLYKAAGAARAVTNSTDPEMRRTACLFIIRAMKRNRELWDDINYYEQHGRWPETNMVGISEDIAQMSVPELIQKQKNLRPWLSKEKKKIDQESDPVKKAQRQSNYDAQRHVLVQVEARLNEL